MISSPKLKPRKFPKSSVTVSRCTLVVSFAMMDHEHNRQCHMHGLIRCNLCKYLLGIIFHTIKPVFLPTPQWLQASQQQVMMDCKLLLQPRYLLHSQELKLLPRLQPSLPQLLHRTEIPATRYHVSEPCL